MVNIPIRSEEPYNRQTILSNNQRKVQPPCDRNTILQQNQSTDYRAAPHAQRNEQVSGTQMPQPAQGTGQPVEASANSGAADKPIPDLARLVRKGQKIGMEENGPLKNIKACFGWNVRNSACDVDVSAFLLDGAKVIGDEWFVFYGQTASPDGSTVFSNSSGPDREEIEVDFTKLNPAVNKIVFVLTINEAFDKKLNFSMIKDAYIRIMDKASNKEIVSFMMDEYYENVTSMMIGEVYKHNDSWKFNAVGNGVSRDLAGLCQLYGVQVD